MTSKPQFIMGVEFHVQLNSKYKLFSRSENVVSHMENTNISYYDIGIPGTFPKINMEAIEKAIIACKLFNCQINNKVIFDRKHYYYLDLPQSYQVTQQEHAIGTNGKYTILNNKVIKINNIHIETDAGKLKQYDNKIVINYDRCGAPLIEIVTETSFDNEDEISNMLHLLIRDLRLNNISDAHPEKGNIRADINISYTHNGFKSVRYEIKNLNSSRGIKRAVTLAKQLLLKNNDKHNLTLLYDDVRNSFVDTRIKEDALGYYYMYEPSLIPTCVRKYIDKQHIIIRSLDIINNIQKVTNVTNDILITIISNDALFKVINYLYNNYINILNRKTILFILDFQDEIHNTQDILMYINILIDAINILTENKANKVDIQSILRQILQSQNVNVNILKIMEEKNMIHKEQSITEENILNIINTTDSMLIHKMAKNSKLIHYAVGIVMKRYKGIKPEYVKQLLINIINKHNNE